MKIRITRKNDYVKVRKGRIWCVFSGGYVDKTDAELVERFKSEILPKYEKK